MIGVTVDKDSQVENGYMIRRAYSENSQNLTDYDLSRLKYVAY